MNSIDRNALPSPDRIWFGSLAGIAGLILICVITMLVGPRACGNTGLSTAGLTVAAATSATATDTRAPGITPSVTPVPSATWTTQPGVTPPTRPPSDTPTPAIVCVPKSRFVADISIPDGSVMAPGMKFVKIWRVANAGDCPWDDGSNLNFAGGSQLGARPTVGIPIAAPGSAVEISIAMQAPNEPGEYKSHWQLQTPSGVPFGRLNVDIVVAATPTPVPKPSISTEGAHLSGIALDPVRGRLFVSGRDANAVFVFNEQSWEVEQEIPVGAQPFGVLYYNDLVYVANFGSDSISVIDASSLQVVRTYSIASFGGEPTFLALDPESGTMGQIFVPLHRGGQLAAIDLYASSISPWGDLTQWPSPASGGGPFGIAAVPGNGRVLVSRRDRYDLVSADSRNPNPDTNPAVSVEGSPYFVAADAAGTRIYLTLSAKGGPSDQPNRLTVFSPSVITTFTSGFVSSGRGNTVDVGYLGDAGGFIAIHPSDGTVWLSDAKTVQVWDRDLTKRLRWYGTPDGVGPSPYGIAINADLGLVYVVNSESNQVVRLKYP